MLDFRIMLNAKHTKWIIPNSKYYFERNVSNRKANGFKYSRMNQVKFVEKSLVIGRPYHLRFIKGCLPQILLGPFLNNLTQIIC